MTNLNNAIQTCDLCDKQVDFRRSIGDEHNVFFYACLECQPYHPEENSCVRCHQVKLNTGSCVSCCEGSYDRSDEYWAQDAAYELTREPLFEQDKLDILKEALADLKEQGDYEVVHSLISDVNRMVMKAIALGLVEDPIALSKYVTDTF